MSAQAILLKAMGLDVEWSSSGAVVVARIGGETYSAWVRREGAWWRWDTATTRGMASSQDGARAQAEASIRLAAVLAGGRV